MDEVESRLAQLEAELGKAQEQIRAATRRRAAHMAEGETRGLAHVENELAELRERRQALLDEQFQLKRQLRAEGAGTVTPPLPPRRVRGAQSAPPLAIRLLLIFLLFGGIAAVAVGGMLYAAERFLVPPPIEGLESATTDDAELDFALREGQSAEERLLALYLAANRAKLLRAPSDDATPVAFEVAPGETGSSIAAKLEAEGFVEDGELFRRLLQYRGADQSLEAGLFTLARNMTMDEIIVALQEGHQAEVTFTLLEGWRADEMAAAIEANGLAAAEEYMALVREPARFDHDFLRDLPDGSTLEGYLFPDTYTLLPDEATAESVIRLQLDTFARRVGAELRQAADARGMALHEAVTLASIVEREAVVAEEREIIAGVFINRWLDGTLLNADPTIQYALGYQPETGEWWKRPLSTDDLALDSPYNSYIHPGLPPGPISNPGLDTIRATIEAPPTEFYYFVARNDGTHVFATTLEEHIRNVEEFQSGD